ncbi:YeeE/YedE family protein [[Eubacterium] cellulosolvens]
MSILIIQYIIALGIGMSTGLVLQRGRVCTNSAFRNLLLIRNGELSTILPVAVAITVTGYFLLTLMPDYEFISNPIHFSFIFLPIGAFIFGLGTVFAGGCAGGVCYRVGEGNVKSLIALLGFILGIGILAAGIIAEIFQYLNNSSLILINNQTPSLEQFAPRSFWTIIIVLGSCLLVYFYYLKNVEHKLTHLRSGWTPIKSGILLGVLGILTKYFSSLPPIYRNFGLSTVDGIANVAQSIVTFQLFNWAGFFIIGLIVGSFLSSLNIKEFEVIIPTRKDVFQFFGGGFLIGIGAMMAGGCNIGHIFGGIPELGISSFFAMVFMIFGNWVGSYLQYIRWKNEWPESTPK